MQTTIRTFLRDLNLLSIDVAAGAAIGAAFFARILHVRLYPQAYAVLGLTVWIIYTCDHLLDAYLLKKPASTARHRLHQRHFKLLAGLVVAAIAANLVLVVFIRRELMMPGFLVAVVCCAYLLLSRWLRFAKEVVGTLLYSSGVLLPAMSLNSDVSFDQGVIIAQFVVIVFINMLLFARMSYETDIRDNHQSLITTIGPKAGDWLIALSFTAFMGLALVPIDAGVVTRLVLVAMAATLLLIFVFREYFLSGERYRVAGDAIFLMPAVLLFLN